jgi:hypothetical protein
LRDFVIIVLLTVVGILVAGVGVIYARKQSRPPRRVLRVDAPAPVPLLATESAAEIGIEVKRNGLALNDPRLITLTLDSDGDYDIARTAFDDNRPIAVDLGAPIIELLQQKGITASFDETTLRLGPDLIKKGSRASLLVLVDGPASTDSLAAQIAASLIDVSVVTSSQTTIARRRGAAGTAAVLGGTAVALVPFVLAGWAFYVDVRGASTSADPGHGAAGSEVRLEGSHFAAFEVVSFRGDYTSTAGEDKDLTIGETQADADGDWELTFTMPDDADIGEVEIVAEGSKYTTEYIDFDVTR